MCTGRTLFYLVGLANGDSWDLKSMWNSEAVALVECKTKDHFILPIVVGQLVTDEVWNEAYYPKRR